MEKIEEECKDFNGRADVDFISKLRNKAITAKQQLSEFTNYDLAIQLPNGKKLFIQSCLFLEITREEFENACAEVLDKLIKFLEKFLAGGRLSPSAIKFLILVGGSSRFLIIRAKLKELLPSSVDILGVSPDLVVAEGSAMLATRIVSFFFMFA